MRQEPRGVFTLSEAAALGWTRHSIGRAVRSGRWQRIARGVYIIGPGEVTPWLRALGLATSTGGTASHVTAARVHQLWSIDPGDWVTVPAGVHRRGRPGLRIHREDLPATDVQLLGALPITTVQRTILDLARRASELQAVAALDCALARRLLMPRELPALCGSARGRARRLLDAGDGRSESPLESAWRLALVQAGLRLTPQLPVVAKGRRFRIDLADEAAQVGLECDGRDVHAAPDALYADRWRANELVAAGWVIVRATWWDYHNRRAQVISHVREALSARGG